MLSNGEKSSAEENSSSLFGPEIILPEQFSDRATLRPSDRGEKRLMLAVLEEAVATFQRHIDARTRSGQRIFQEAEDWILSQDADWPFAFENICYALDIEPAFLRSGLVKWKETQMATAKEPGARVYRFPFRRVNGRRSSISLRDHGMRAAS